MENKIRIFALLFVLLIFFKNVDAFGVAYSDFLCPNNPVKLSPGQEKSVQLWLQNMVGDSDIKLEVVLRDSQGIAEMREKTYNVKAKTEDTIVPVVIKIPEDAQVGSKYNVVVAFDTVTSGEGGGVSTGTGMDVKICVEVVGFSAVEPKLSPETGNVTWIIGAIVFVLIVVIVSLIVLRRKKRNKSFGNLRY